MLLPILVAVEKQMPEILEKLSVSLNDLRDTIDKYEIYKQNKTIATYTMEMKDDRRNQ